ncbi:MAG: DNA cytosine methyltransferase [Phycisphaerales bacterium]
MTSQGLHVSAIAIDAFCGAGGLSLGLQNAGFTVAAAFDVDSTAIRTYRHNLGDHGFVADIRDLDGASLLSKYSLAEGQVDLVAGGPPCQGFSVQRRGGHSDARNTLPSEYLRLIREVSPRFFLLENVPGMRGRHGEAILKAFIDEANHAGFVCHQAVLDAVEFSVPQYRRRLFVVGERPTNGRLTFQFPAPTSDCRSPATSVRSAIGDLPAPPGDLSPHPDIANHRRTRLSPLNQQRIEMIPPGGGMRDLPPSMRAACHRQGADRIGHRFVYGRLHWDQPSATITARFDSFTRGKFGHPESPRNLTLREGARLQTFPDTFEFFGSQEEIAAQIGNAVPPRLAAALGQAILAGLRRAPDEGRLSPLTAVPNLFGQ